MLSALDAYVLSGAIRVVSRLGLDSPKLIRHHTMLVHESVKTADQEIRRSHSPGLAVCGLYLPMGLKRLQGLWVGYVRSPAARARSPRQ